MSDEWLTELPPDHDQRTSHKALSIELRSRPGVWRRVGTYASRTGAVAVASTIRTGRRPAWAPRPGGHYEAEPRTTRTGVHRVYARWVSDRSPR